MSTPAFSRIEPTPFPSGYGFEIATVRREIDHFARTFGLTFYDGWDNLGWYDAAALRLSSGRLLGLLRHRGAPRPGTEIHADAHDDFAAALREFLDAFDLSVDDLTWMHDDVSAEDLRPAEERARA
jgi:hypothetical protein